MSIRVWLSPHQEDALRLIEEGKSVHPSTRRSLIRLGFLTTSGEFTYRVDMYRNGQVAYKPERTRG